MSVKASLREFRLNASKLDRRAVVTAIRFYRLSASGVLRFAEVK